MTTTTTTHSPASPKQIALIQRLLREKVVEPDKRDWIETVMEAGRLTGGYHGTASRTIEHLFGCPDVPHEEAKPGYYMRGEYAFKVQTNKAGTHTYALVWSGTSWDYVPGVARNLAGLTPMTATQAAALGLASGRCINCAKVLGGETLSAKVSALIGYGEVCARHNGWPYPKGVKAQRAYVAEHGETV